MCIDNVIKTTIHHCKLKTNQTLFKKSLKTPPKSFRLQHVLLHPPWSNPGYGPLDWLKKCNICKIKGTVNVISSDPLCQDGNTRFTTVPMEDIVVFLGLKVLISDSFCKFSCSGNTQVTFVVKPQLKMIIFQS